MTRRACKGTNRFGRPCKAHPLKNGEFCLAHDEVARESTGFGGSQPGAGRPKLPKVTDLMLKRVEEEAEAILAPYFRAIAEAKVYATEKGEVIVSDVDDLGARIAAAEKLLDRVYGKPRQSTELSGPDGGPITTEIVAVDAGDPATRKLAHQLLERMAGRAHPD